MAEAKVMDKIQCELREAMEVPKCREGGGMKERLQILQTWLSCLQVDASPDSVPLGVKKRNGAFFRSVPHL